MDMLTINQAADILGLSSRRVTALAKNRKLGRKIGVQWFFTPAEVDNMRARQIDRGPWLKYKERESHSNEFPSVKLDKTITQDDIAKL